MNRWYLGGHSLVRWLAGITPSLRRYERPRWRSSLVGLVWVFFPRRLAGARGPTRRRRVGSPSARVGQEPRGPGVVCAPRGACSMRSCGDGHTQYAFRSLGRVRLPPWADTPTPQGPSDGSVTQDLVSHSRICVCVCVCVSMKEKHLRFVRSKLHSGSRSTGLSGRRSLYTSTP